MKDTGERVLPDEIRNLAEYSLFKRHQFVYNVATKVIKKNDLVVDYGCGEGYGTLILSKFSNHVYGIDNNREVLEYLNLKKMENVIFENDHNFFSSESKFDIIVCFQVLEHIRDDVRFIHELIRKTKKGGTIYLTTPNKKLRLKSTGKIWNEFHFREYSKSNLESLLKSISCVFEIKGVSGKFWITKMEKVRIRMQRNNENNLVSRIIRKWNHFLMGIINYIFRRYIKSFPSDGYQITDKRIENSLDFYITIHCE